MIITSASTRLGLGSELDNFVMIFKLTGWKISVWHSEGCKVWKQTSPNSESTANFKAKEKQNTKKQKFGSCVSKSQKILWTINFVKYRKINLSSHFSLKTLDLILCHVTVAQGGHNVFQCHKNVNFCNNFVGCRQSWLPGYTPVFQKTENNSEKNTFALCLNKSIKSWLYL